MALSLASKLSLQDDNIFNGSSIQAWALAKSPAHHVNQPYPAVQFDWFGWHGGLEQCLCPVGEALSYRVGKLVVDFGGQKWT